MPARDEPRGQSRPTWEPPADVTTVVWPEESTIDGGYLALHEATWHVLDHSPDGAREFLGDWTDTFDEVVESGQRLLRMRQRFVLHDGTVEMEASTLMDRRSLRPVRVEQRGQRDQSATVRYAGAEVSGHVRSGSDVDVREFSRSFPRALWDIAATGWLLLGTELIEGASMAIPYSPLRPGPDDIDWEVLTVERRERTQAPDDVWLDAWVVTNRRGWTYWMIQAAPYVLRLEISGPDGTRVWSLAEYDVFDDD